MRPDLPIILFMDLACWTPGGLWPQHLWARRCCTRGWFSARFPAPIFTRSAWSIFIAQSSGNNFLFSVFLHPNLFFLFFFCFPSHSFQLWPLVPPLRSYSSPRIVDYRLIPHHPGTFRSSYNGTTLLRRTGMLILIGFIANGKATWAGICWRHCQHFYVVTLVNREVFNVTACLFAYFDPTCLRCIFVH